jgi:hypothetical protein
MGGAGERAVVKRGAPALAGSPGRPGFKHSLPWLGLALVLAGCSRLDTLSYVPAQTPQTWLSIQPYLPLRIAGMEVVLVQPTTTAIVYLLGAVTLGAGLHFLRIRQGQRSRTWWGIALLLWGLGALLAGTSYEAFSYAIKCAGRETCLWTSWWEIGYLVSSVASVDAMLVAVAYSCTLGKGRRVLQLYALLNFTVYLGLVLTGVLVPVRFLISFELLLLAAAPNILVLLAINGGRYARSRQRLDLLLIGAWVWLGLTIAAYFLYFISGWTQSLWARGVWFSENDVLHIGLILWMVYLAWGVAPHVRDATEALELI